MLHESIRPFVDMPSGLDFCKASANANWLCVKEGDVVGGRSDAGA